MEFKIDGNKLLKCINNGKEDVAIIPEYIKVIGTSAFEQDFYLKEIILHEKIEELETEAFGNCKKLEKIILPKGLKRIPSWAFAGCNNLKNIDIPESVEQIGCGISYFCENLKNINVPSYQVFRLLTDSTRYYALYSIIKKYYENENKFKDNEINNIKEFIIECKKYIYSAYIQNKLYIDSETIQFLLYEIDNLFTKDELYGLLEKIENLEAKAKILNYLKPNESIEQTIDNMYHL